MNNDDYNDFSYLGNLTGSPMIKSRFANLNYMNSPEALRFQNQAQASKSAQELLMGSTTPVGALSAGIATYLAKKQENKSLEALNKRIEMQMAQEEQQRQMQMAQEEQQRQNILGSIPEERRGLAQGLTGKDLTEFAMQSQPYEVDEQKLNLENKRLLNQQLQKEIMSSDNELDKRYKYLRTKKLEQELSGETPLKPLPPTALKLQNEALDIIGTANGINADLDQVVKQIDDKTLKLGPVENLRSQALNAAGFSTPESRNFASFRATLEKQRNDSLRLNKGVQTEGDAQRAWNELFNNLNDKKVVKQRLEEIQKINKRGADLQKLQVDQIRANYGAPPVDFTQFENRPAALGGGNGTFTSSSGVKFTIKR